MSVDLRRRRTVKQNDLISARTWNSDENYVTDVSEDRRTFQFPRGFSGDEIIWRLIGRSHNFLLSRRHFSQLLSSILGSTNFFNWFNCLGDIEMTRKMWESLCNCEIFKDSISDDKSLQSVFFSIEATRVGICKWTRDRFLSISIAMHNCENEIAMRPEVRNFLFSWVKFNWNYELWPSLYFF